MTSLRTLAAGSASAGLWTGVVVLPAACVGAGWAGTTWIVTVLLAWAGASVLVACKSWQAERPRALAGILSTSALVVMLSLLYNMTQFSTTVAYAGDVLSDTSWVGSWGSVHGVAARDILVRAGWPWPLVFAIASGFYSECGLWGVAWRCVWMSLVHGALALAIEGHELADAGERGGLLEWWTSTPVALASCLCLTAISHAPAVKRVSAARGKMAALVEAGAVIAVACFAGGLGALICTSGKGAATCMASCVVVCDTGHMGTWFPTGSPRDEEWRGDYCEYNLDLALESCRAAGASVHTIGDQIVEECLAGVDVLVLCTPTIRYAAKEVVAIQRFVAHGGRLICIGDHTDMMGSGGILNEVLSPTSLRFSADHVESIGATFPLGFGGCLGTYGEPAPVSIMTGCSVSVGWGALPVLVTYASQCLAADYANNNQFGQLPAVRCIEGRPVVGAACCTYGLGSAWAIGDGTMLSGFGLVGGNRIRFWRWIIGQAADPQTSSWIASASMLYWSFMTLIPCWVLSLLVLRGGCCRLIMLGAAPLIGGTLAAGWNCVNHAWWPNRILVAADLSQLRVPDTLGEQLRDPEWAFDTFLCEGHRVHRYPETGCFNALDCQDSIVLYPREGFGAVVKKSAAQLNGKVIRMLVLSDDLAAVGAECQIDSWSEVACWRSQEAVVVPEIRLLTGASAGLNVAVLVGGQELSRREVGHLFSFPSGRSARLLRFARKAFELAFPDDHVRQQ